MPSAARRCQARRSGRRLPSPHTRRSVHRQAPLSSPSDKAPLIALTSGEPAGIGPDICIRLALEADRGRLVFLGDPGTFEDRARALGLAPDLTIVDDFAEAEPQRPGLLQLKSVPLAEPAVAGRLDPANAHAVLDMLRLAAAACRNGAAAAMVTAPVQKSTINAAGIAFTGHTEFLAEITGAGRVVMMLASPRLRVALVTTHLPLAAVPAAITRERLGATLDIVARDLRDRFGIANPRLLVLGLNPHAGEDGVLGTEERDTIRPVLEQCRREGIDAAGPVAADTAFTPASLATCDAVVAMYHDQGLPALKAQDFGEVVNLTLGLPIIRTSVDHGTALALAGSGRASHASLVAACDLALALAARAA